MDILGDIGSADQLTSARAENDVLQEKVKQLTERVKFLTVENETLKAEVELYRNEAAVSGLSRLSMNANEAVDNSSNNNTMQTDNVMQHDYFIKSGNGIYPNQNEVTLSHWFGSANPLCCTFSTDDTLVAAGAANGYLNVVPWGALDAKQPDRMRDDNDEDDSAKQFDAFVQSQSLNMSLNSPIICASFSPYLSRSHGTRAHVLAAGCMDGSFQVVKLNHSSFHGLQLASTTLSNNVTKEYKHGKYIRTVAWSPTHPLLATASADGNVQILQVQEEHEQVKHGYDDSEETPSHLSLTCVQSLHFPGAVESLTFLNDHQLVCYARGTPYLSVFDMSNDFAQSRIHLNSPNGKTVDDHVSFAVLDLNVWQNKFLVAATDAARNMVIDIASGQQVRNLYGHANDGYSQPKAVWSQNGQYILGNTQDDGALCIWDIASSRMVERVSTAHAIPIRNLFSSPSSDMLVTTSFDKQTKLWFAPQQ